MGLFWKKKKEMKVKELINQLTEFNMDAEIRIGDIKYMKGDKEAIGDEFLDNDIIEKPIDYEIADIFSVDDNYVDLTLNEIKK
jgi:hypothetical protein